MQILTKENLDTAIKKCRENERYKVLIVTKYKEDHIPILDKLVKSGVDAIHNSNNSFVRFLNGSYIELISSSKNNTCGARADLVLYQEDVCNECEEMKYILKAIETKPIDFKVFKNQEVQ